MTIGERFAQALDIIYGKRNSNKVAEEFNITPQTVGQLKKKNALTETMCLISEKKGININWLFTNQGEMFIDNGKIEENKSKYENLDNLNENNDLTKLVMEDFKSLDKKDQKTIYLAILSKLKEKGEI